MANLFLSYRRSDCGAYAERLALRLRAYQFETVFLDRDGIDLADDYSERIRSALSRATAVLVLIGRHWSDATDAAGRRRLDEPSDWVRREVELALSLGVPIVPVLFDGAQMPGAADVPAELAALTRAQGYDISQNYFDRDADDFARRLERRLIAGARATGRGSATAAGSGVLLRQLQLIWIGLFCVTAGVAVVPAFVPPVPDTFWIFPGTMTVAAFAWWLYCSSLSLRPAALGTT